MREEDLKHFRCPKCRKGKISLASNEYQQDDDIIEAKLKCQDCEEIYLIKEGVGRFLPSNNGNYTDSFGMQWNLNRTTQLDSYTGFNVTEKRIFKTTGWPYHMEGINILEAGSGAGRFTEILLKTEANVFSFDLSQAVRANYKNNGEAKNLHLFQADIMNIPLEKNAFDKVMCLGVLQHTPDPHKAFKSLTGYVRTGGELAIDIYPKRFSSMFSWKYLLRPITTRLDKKDLYKITKIAVSALLPLAVILRRFAGKIGARLIPITEYSYLGLPYSLNKEWAILDTFDMYSPKYDNPQTLSTVKEWFRESGFKDIVVEYGPNGVIGRGVLGG